MNLNSLTEYSIDDIEKKRMLEEALHSSAMMEIRSLEKRVINYNAMPDMDMNDYAPCKTDTKFHVPVEPAKFCPQCGEKFPESENFCLDCGIRLKEIKDIDVRDIEISPQFKVSGSLSCRDFKEILTDENLERINLNDINIHEIIRNIRFTALKRLDYTIKENNILLKDLTVLDRIILFVKSFVNMEYKSYGPELGYYEFNKIYIDDRQLDALQITTLLHELAHFLNKEILTHVLCKLLDMSKTTEIESIITFILSYSPLNRLIDEYAAHTVEARFTLYGFQDYSSFVNIQNSIDMPEGEIEMLKTIGNTFADIIKEILESFIDYDMLEDIKYQFKADILDRPDYRNLRYENCTLLNREGLDRAFRFILADGFVIAMDNITTLEQYNQNW